MKGEKEEKEEEKVEKKKKKVYLNIHSVPFSILVSGVATVGPGRACALPNIGANLCKHRCIAILRISRARIRDSNSSLTSQCAAAAGKTTYRRVYEQPADRREHAMYVPCLVRACHVCTMSTACSNSFRVL